jgi:type I restriction enzyme M protein
LKLLVSDRSSGERWQPFAVGEVRKREFKLDGFKWLKEESAEDADELPEPEELAAEAMAELKDVFGELEEVLKLLPNGRSG